MGHMTEVLLKEYKGASSSTEANSDQVHTIKIAYIGGGSRGWAHSLINDLARCPHMRGEVRLYDIDHDAACFNAKWGNWIQTHPDARSTWRYRAVKTIKTALKGADFVFLSIQPGRIQDMKVDLEEPTKYGIFHPVGDTVGPAGINRALRSIPIYKQFGEAIAQYAPTAWVINFTNPMTVCTRTLYKAYPEIKAFGCCHEVFGTQSNLAELYHTSTGQPRPSREQIRVNVLGINHFTWLDRAECDGVDLLDLVARHIRKRNTLKPLPEKELAKGGIHASRSLVAYNLFQRFGILAAAGDRHLAEFVPWFLTSEDSHKRWSFNLTPYSHRIERWNTAPKRFRKRFNSGNLPRLRGSGEEFINQMLALLGSMSFRTNVNLPNRGQMGKTPSGAVVETNAIFSKNAVEPVISGRLPDPVNILVQRHICNQETLIKACFEQDEDLAFQAFLNDPLVNIPLDDAWKLFRAMTRKTRVCWSS